MWRSDDVSDVAKIFQSAPCARYVLYINQYSIKVIEDMNLIFCTSIVNTFAYKLVKYYRTRSKNVKSTATVSKLYETPSCKSAKLFEKEV